MRLVATSSGPPAPAMVASAITPPPTPYGSIAPAQAIGRPIETRVRNLRRRQREELDECPWPPLLGIGPVGGPRHGSPARPLPGTRPTHGRPGATVPVA